MMAAAANQPECVEELCRWKANLQAKDSDGYRYEPWHHFVFQEGGPDGLHAAGVPLGRDPLMYAAVHGSVDLANAILAAGADSAAISEFRETALSIAVESDQASMVRLLLDSGSDPDARLGNRETVIFSAVRMGNAAMVRLLIAAGAKAELKNSGGNTALHEAVSARCPEVVRLLVEAGVRSDVANRRRITAADLASNLKAGPETTAILAGSSVKGPSGPGKRRGKPKPRNGKQR